MARLDQQENALNGRYTSFDTVKVTRANLKFGPTTIWRGPDVPPNDFGRNGDIFIYDSTARVVSDDPSGAIPPNASLYQKRPTASGDIWVELGGSTQTVTTSGLVIPTPMVQIESGVLESPQEFRVKFTQSIEHLSALNPRICLMRYRQGKARHPGIRSNKRWVHPTHQNGINGSVSMNSGGHHDTAGGLMPPRDTEWDVSNLAAFRSTVIPLDLVSWFKPLAVREGPYLVMSGDKNANGSRIASRSQAFAFCLEIDNPDPATQADIPRIRGPISASFAVRCLPSGVNPVVQIAFGHIPMARTKP